MTAMVRVGLLDSGVGADVARHVAASRAFVADSHGGVVCRPAEDDRLGHGSELARIVLAAAPKACLVSAQVFVASYASTTAAVAAGLDWLVAQGVDLVNLSFGLRHDREVLRRACGAAVEAGVLLIAAAPARGPAVYPAAYDGVVRVSGDARCALGEISALHTAQADFGAHPHPLGAPGRAAVRGGASFAAAHLSGAVARYVAATPAADRRCVVDHLERRASYHGPERRGSTARRPLDPVADVATGALMEPGSGCK